MASRTGFEPARPEGIRLATLSSLNLRPGIPPDAASPLGNPARALATTPATATSYAQREGGGINVYKSAIPSFLRSILEMWTGYILMQMIVPPGRQECDCEGGVGGMGKG